MEQNIFDNQTFFDGYKNIRENEASANNLVEKPALFSLCPSFVGAHVLDMGCGYGENCREFIKLGAKSVLGIDLSEKMLEIARAENYDKRISYLQMSMNDLSSITTSFDIILSSLAMHYIEDFDALLKEVFQLLKPNGIFIFSQEHPLTTASKQDPYWTKNEQGELDHYHLRTYSKLGERTGTWIVDDVVSYHRSFSSIVNSLIQAGFVIEAMLEPVPDESIMIAYPAYRRYEHKPDFLLLRVRKP